MYQAPRHRLCFTNGLNHDGEAIQTALFERGTIMNLRTTAARRLLAAGALAGAAALVPASALAAPGATARAGHITTPACTTSGLDVWLDTQGNGTAGTTFYNLEFTNLSGGTCTLFGFPGVSATNLTGTQLGSAAFRSGTPHTVTLANGATAIAVLGITEASNFSQCNLVTAAGLRVFPPGQTQSRRIPFPFPACSNTGPQYLEIMPIG
jgi:hypothetical protein